MIKCLYMGEMKPPKIGDQKPKTKGTALLKNESKNTGSSLSKGVNIPDEEILMQIPIEERTKFLAAKSEVDFLEYYGEAGERIIQAISKEEEEKPSDDVSYKNLLIDISRYAMHMPESAYQTPKAVLEERARSLFRKSADILETIQELRQYVKNDINTDDIKRKKISDYINNLHNNALTLIKSRFSVFQQQNEGTLWYLAQTKSIEKDLEISDEELFLNLYWFKYAKENIPPPSIEDIIGHKINLISSKELSPDDQNDIIKIYEENWKLENQETKKALIDNIKNSFTSTEDNSHFVVIRNHKEIAGFIRFENKGEFEFASALNVREEYKNFGIAQALLDSSLRVRSLLHPIHARARLTLDYTQKYIEDFNAVGTSIENYHGSPHLNMIFSKVEKQRFMTSNLELNEILALNNEDIKVEKLKTLQELSIPNNFTLTRTISDPNGGIYCILEKDSKEG